jgi:hypothetical protein
MRVSGKLGHEPDILSNQKVTDGPQQALGTPEGAETPIIPIALAIGGIVVTGLLLVANPSLGTSVLKVAGNFFKKL